MVVFTSTNIVGVSILSAFCFFLQEVRIANLIFLKSPDFYNGSTVVLVNEVFQSLLGL